MFSIKREPDALDLSHRTGQIFSNHSEHDETFSTEEEVSDCIPKKMTYDSGFVDTTDENNASITVKQESNHHYHSTPLRPQQIQPHLRHPSTSSSTCSSPTRQHEKESRNTRFLGSRAVAILNQWFQANRDYPYPDDERTEQLADEAGITQKQVKKWFANKRVRSQMCYKPLYRSRKMREMPGAQTQTRPQATLAPVINPNNVMPAGFNVLPPNPMLFNPMAASSMMMLMMQQQWVSTMMAVNNSKNTTSVSSKSEAPSKPNRDRITRFWL